MLQRGHPVPHFEARTVEGELFSYSMPEGTGVRRSHHRRLSRLWTPEANGAWFGGWGCRDERAVFGARHSRKTRRRPCSRVTVRDAGSEWSGGRGTTAGDPREYLTHDTIAARTIEAKRLRCRCAGSLHQQPAQVSPSTRETRLDDVLGCSKTLRGFRRAEPPTSRSTNTSRMPSGSASIAPSKRPRSSPANA